MKVSCATIELHTLSHFNNPLRLQRIWNAIDRLDEPERLWTVFTATLDCEEFRRLTGETATDVTTTYES